MQKNDQILGSWKRTKKKIMEHGSDSDTNYDWCTWNGPQMQAKRVGRFGNRTTSWEYCNYSIFEISQNTEKRPEDLLSLRLLRSLTSTYTDVKKSFGVITIIISLFQLIWNAWEQWKTEKKKQINLGKMKIMVMPIIVGILRTIS